MSKDNRKEPEKRGFLNLLKDMQFHLEPEKRGLLNLVEDITVRLAAENGDASAQYTLGVMYYNGNGVPQDYQEAAKWYLLAAEQGDADAQSFLGVIYYNGKGIPQDYQEAMKWHRLAAEQGAPYSQYTLGVMYISGNGVPQDAQKAMKWFRRLVVRNRHRHPPPQDAREAMKWFRLAAEQGQTGAQFNLGVGYAHGQGVRKNYIQAHKWINLAASRTTPGKEESYRSMRDTLAVTMTASQLADAQRLAREWEPKTWEQLKDE